MVYFRPQKNGALRFASVSEHVCDSSCLCDHCFNLYEVSSIGVVVIVFDFGICFAMSMNIFYSSNDKKFIRFVFYGCRAIHRANCYHKEGRKAGCKSKDSFYMVIFGVAQIIVSQIPDFHNMALLSWMSAIMSFCYSSIGLGLGFAKVIGRYSLCIPCLLR